MYGGNDPDASAINFSTIGTPDLELGENRIYLYPNPATNTMTIMGLENTLESVEIYNSAGQKTTAFSNNLTSLNIQSLPSGVYFVK